MEWNKISRKLIINYEYSMCMNLKNISDRTKVIIFHVNLFYLTYTKSINPFLGHVQGTS